MIGNGVEVQVIYIEPTSVLHFIISFFVSHFGIRKKMHLHNNFCIQIPDYSKNIEIIHKFMKNYFFTGELIINQTTRRMGVVCSVFNLV